jgi:hypothetical protein
MTESKSMHREGSSAMNVEFEKDGSNGLRADAVVLGDRGSYDWGPLIASSVGAMGPDPRGGQLTGPPPHRVFSSISAPKFLTTVHT